MKRPSILIIVIIVLLVLLVPLIKVSVVPERTIKVLDEQGNPQNDIEVRQIWNHYSFDGSGVSNLYGGEEVRTSAANGEITFPERSFRVGAASWLWATLGSPSRWINVHASTGPHSYFLCVRSNCSQPPSYRGNPEDLENNLLIVESKETIRKRLKEIIGKTEQSPMANSRDDAVNDGPPPPPIAPQKEPARQPQNK